MFQLVRHQFQNMLAWEYIYVCHDLRTEKQEIYVKQREYKTRNWHTADLRLGN